MTEVKVDLNKQVDFSYPEGWEEACAALDFEPDPEERAKLLKAFTSAVAMS